MKTEGVSGRILWEPQKDTDGGYAEHKRGLAAKERREHKRKKLAKTLFSLRVFAFIVDLSYPSYPVFLCELCASVRTREVGELGKKPQKDTQSLRDDTKGEDVGNDGTLGLDFLTKQTQGVRLTSLFCGESEGFGSLSEWLSPKN